MGVLMSDDLVETEVGENWRLYICFGQIKRDALTMRSTFSMFDAEFNSAVIVKHDDLHVVLEQCPVSTSRERETGSCGPMFWAFKGDMTRVLQRCH
jgi:hypothetical protein